MDRGKNILIAGMAGASLGSEIVKCLKLAGQYSVFGCDISPHAFGLYSVELAGSFIVDRNNYIRSILDICAQNNIQYIIPGGEQPMVLLSANDKDLSESGIVLVCNNTGVIKQFSDKENTFQLLKKLGFPVPKTCLVTSAEDIKGFGFPCIVKPSTGTRGSDSVFLANNAEECLLYVELLRRNGRKVIVQEYIDLEEGEFTIGVLSDTRCNVISSVCMKRIFDSKLSVAFRSKNGMISSGYSQGLIDDFPDLRGQAEAIAKASGSTGPLNIQGRVKGGVLIPFEINPRFSASTYLRAMAGVNEVHLFLQHLMGQQVSTALTLKKGYYLRTFNEGYVPLEMIKK